MNATSLEGLEQLSCLAKGVKDLKREEEANYEQSSEKDLGGHSIIGERSGIIVLFLLCKRRRKVPIGVTSLPYELKVWWDSKYENERKMRVQLIKTWSSLKQSLRHRFGVGNHEGLRQGQPKFPKNKELSQAKIEEGLKIHVEDETSKEEPFVS
ncbi:hypothetical protein M9H77_04271 [Catharanthus roseus]|uniref:Uncharacterized protein n=1 Tax=Catharanthus roseus TaxID=4058 RepID=A0ACC0CE13_CATRO|nr:hypothetical protein M9H77_04271 [Catharanthus roseus]